MLKAETHSQKLSCINWRRVNYFKNSFLINYLEVTIQDGPLSNICNYNYTNLTDNLGKKKCAMKRGAKYHFSPMKRARRKVLDDHKLDNSKDTSVRKNKLPQFLEYFTGDGSKVSLVRCL